MNLPPAKPDYDARDEQIVRRVVSDADKKNRKTGQDVEVARNERLILADSVTGERGVVTVTAGVFTWTAL